MYSPGGGLGPVTNPCANTANSRGTTLTASATANTDGAWVSLFDIARYENRSFDALYVTLQNPSASAAGRVDIGIENSAAQTHEIIADLELPHRGASTSFASYYIPINILQLPAGNTGSIRGRCQCATASATVDVHAVPILRGVGNMPGGRIITLGATSLSRGTGTDASATANTKAAYVQITASAPADIRAIAFAVDPQNDIARTGVPINIVHDIATGAAGSETVVIPNHMMQMNTTTDFNAFRAFEFMPVSIAAGQRIAARAQCNITTAGDRTTGVILYGLVGGL